MIQSSNRFAVNPTNIDIQRSKFPRVSQNKTAYNAGELIPIYLDEVLPGDTFSMDMASLTRMSTPANPVMDNAFADDNFFFVPARLLWDHWQEFHGENNTTFWEQSTEYSIPQITAPAGGWSVGSIADLFGLPVNVENISVSALPFRAYCKIFNDWYRDENLVTPLNFETGDADVVGSNGSDYVVDCVLGGRPAKVAKIHDYFTSALPAPQKGSPVNIGTAFDGVPVVTGMDNSLIDGSGIPLRLINSGGNQLNGTGSYFLGAQWGYGVDGVTVGPTDMKAFSDGLTESSEGVYAAGLGDSSSVGVIPTNLVVSNQLNFTINDLRFAFQLQKALERDARGGTRYIEIIKSHFGVTSPDARLQRSEFIGGKRSPITMNQVLQQSASQDGQSLGQTGAYSLTTNRGSFFTYSATEHGYIIGLRCIRTEHTYSQGIERLWSRKNRFEFYYPVFANIGEQAVLNKEIFATGTSSDDEVFGYQEAWAEYRYKPNRVCSIMRPYVDNGLFSWTYSDNYNSTPVLGSGWIAEPTENVDRTLLVSSKLSYQFFSDFYFDCKVVRPLPMYSIPGFIDHH